MTEQTMDSINDQEQQITAAQEEQHESQQDLQDQENQEQQPGEGQEQSENSEQPPQQKRNGVQKRIDELTRKAYEASREAKYWREQHAAKQAEPSSNDAPAKPVRTDFADDDAYFEALAEFKVEQKVRRLSQQTQAERAHEAQARHDATRFELYQQRVAESAPSDYQDVVGGSDVPAAPHVLESILDSEHGPALAYHLAKNPDVAQQLNEMTPLQAAREIGRLETQLQQPKKETTPEKRTTKAPEPITPVRGGNGQFLKSPEAMTDAEWFASRKT